MAKQHLPLENVNFYYRYGTIPECDADDPQVQGLHLLHGLQRLRCINLYGFDADDHGIRRFQAAHPNVRVVFQHSGSLFAM